MIQMGYCDPENSFGFSVPQLCIADHPRECAVPVFTSMDFTGLGKPEFFALMHLESILAEIECWVLARIIQHPVRGMKVIF
jgi:hypothetical protein